MDTRFQHLAHRNCHVNSPRGLGLKPAAVPPHERARRLSAPCGRHPGCAGLRFGTCKTRMRVPQSLSPQTPPQVGASMAFECRLSQRV
ncbi:hypothetical protein EGY31_19900 [Burkholderia multivorans]|nr:hypothetical protein EGY31_19900 [Burkholderia multivorans]